MATKKSGKKKKANKNKSGEPQLLPVKEGLTAAQFAKEVNMMMDEPMSGVRLKDFQASLEAIVERELQEGNLVNLFGLVKIVPRLHTKGSKMVPSVFGDKESPKVKKNYKAKVSLKATQGIFTKKVKDALPSTQKLAKKLGV